jgi:hypothetical protein
MTRPKTISMLLIQGFLVTVILGAGAVVRGAELPLESAEQPPQIPVGLDAYRQWDRWPYQRIGARAYMRSTYDRAGGNETADASHFLYQLAEDFNVTLDVEGAGVLYFKRTNHWHGSPWHYEVDGTRHLVQETTTADPTRMLEDAVFLPEHLFPHPLTWTYSQTHGADLMWVPIPFEQRLRLAYSRTFYGTGYYIYHLYDRAARLSQPLRAWDGQTPPSRDVLDLLRAAGTDIAPRQGDGTPWGQQVEAWQGTVRLPQDVPVELTMLTNAPSMLRALELSAPRDQAVVLGHARLRITWDERTHPSVDAPVALFFGSGTLHNRDHTEYLVRALPVHIRFDDQRVHLACYFPMPFFRSARIELVGATELPIDDVHWAVRTVPYTDPPNHVGYFHATYRDHADARPGHDLVFLDTRAAEGGGDWSGSFVGTAFIFTDRGVLNTLEGDPRFFFDDSQTPQAQGTGTEEWGGGGDYWGGRNMTIPLAGHPVGTRTPEEAASPEERIHSAYRYLLADLMPFGHRALIRFEHGDINLSREHYRSVTYWYGLPAPSLVLTDELNVGDTASEQAHGYQSPQASQPYTITSRYEWGPDTLPLAASPQSETVLAQPQDFAEFEFRAAGDTTYTIWVRGKTAGGHLNDATWFQFNDAIGTTELGEGHSHPKGFGNWRDDTSANTWSWSSALPQDPPQTVRFGQTGYATAANPVKAQPARDRSDLVERHPENSPHHKRTRCEARRPRRLDPNRVGRRRCQDDPWPVSQDRRPDGFHRPGFGDRRSRLGRDLSGSHRDRPREPRAFPNSRSKCGRIISACCCAVRSITSIRISGPRCMSPTRKPVNSSGNMRACGTWPVRTPGTTPILAKKVNWGRPGRSSRHRTAGFATTSS